MTDNEITREKTFSEELPYFKERISEVFDNYDNLNDSEDPLYIDVLRDSKRIVRKAEEEITRQQSEIDKLKTELKAMRSAANSLKMHYEAAQAEIKGLNAKNMLTVSEKNAFRTSFYNGLKQLKTAKAEAYKEFAEKLKKRIYKGGVHPTVEDEFMCDIDNLVKEMVGDSE